MLTSCRVCSSTNLELIHQSTLDHTLTSESKLRPGKLNIVLCPNCSHLMSDEGGLTDVARYYGQEYDSLLDNEESDDLYDLDSNQQPIYRSQIQLENMLRLVRLPSKGRILDFGCGKGGFLTRFKRQNPDWALHGFDVSERYRTFLEPITGAGNFYAGSLGEAPKGKDFDLITMFFVAEHLIEPPLILKEIVARLTPTGLLYLTVPNVITNSIDAFLADHLSHFSTLSLTSLLHRCGLRPIVVSEHHQLGQITMVSTPDPELLKSKSANFKNDTVDAYSDKIRGSVRYWVDCISRLNEFLATRQGNGGTLAVYGAGVFGSYLAVNSGKALQSIRCFFDQNPFKVGKEHLGKPILSPKELPHEVSDVLVGLNPGRAKEIMQQAGLLDNPKLRFFFP